MSMMTEELVFEEMPPLNLEIEFADEDEAIADLVAEAGLPAPAENGQDDHTDDKSLTKKEQILSLYRSGVTDVAQIVRRVTARPSYVAQVLQSIINGKPRTTPPRPSRAHFAFDSPSAHD